MENIQRNKKRMFDLVTCPGSKYALEQSSSNFYKPKVTFGNVFENDTFEDYTRCNCCWLIGNLKFIWCNCSNWEKLDKNGNSEFFNWVVVNCSYDDSDIIKQYTILFIIGVYSQTTLLSNKFIRFIYSIFWVITYVAALDNTYLTVLVLIFSSNRKCSMLE